jgi:hypothetical protein
MFTGLRIGILSMLLVVLVLTGWSGYWFFAQTRAEHEIERQVAACRRAAATSPAPTGSGGDSRCASHWSATAPGSRFPAARRSRPQRLEAIGHLYDPRQVVAYTDRISLEGSPDWSAGARNIDVAAKLATLDRLEFSASGEALAFANGRMPAVAVDALEVEGSLDNPPRGRQEDLAALLREAARLGSRVTIDRFEARMADIDVTASGSVAFGPEGPTGTLETTVSNYAQVLADLERRGVISRQAARGSTMVLGFLQGKKSDDEMTVSLRFHEGQVFWGPFVVAEIPPLE